MIVGAAVVDVDVEVVVGATVVDVDVVLVEEVVVIDGVTLIGAVSPVGATATVPASASALLKYVPEIAGTRTPKCSDSTPEPGTISGPLQVRV